MAQDCRHSPGEGGACLNLDQWQQEVVGGWRGPLAPQEIGRDGGVGDVLRAGGSR